MDLLVVDIHPILPEWLQLNSSMRRGFQAKNLENNVRKSNYQEQSYQEYIFNRDATYLKQNKPNKIMIKTYICTVYWKMVLTSKPIFMEQCTILQIICE